MAMGIAALNPSYDFKESCSALPVADAARLAGPDL